MDRRDCSVLTEEEAGDVSHALALVCRDGSVPSSLTGVKKAGKTGIAGNCSYPSSGLMLMVVVVEEESAAHTHIRSNAPPWGALEGGPRRSDPGATPFSTLIPLCQCLSKLKSPLVESWADAHRPRPWFPPTTRGREHRRRRPHLR
jgi:hypothetical protein